MPSGDEVTELRISVPETGRRLLPLPVAAWHATVGRATVDAIAKGDAVLVHGQLVRRFYRSGAGARSLTEGSPRVFDGWRSASTRREPRSAHGHEHESGAGLRPEERRLARESVAVPGRREDDLGRGRRQDVGRDGAAGVDGVLRGLGAMRE